MANNNSWGLTHSPQAYQTTKNTNFWSGMATPSTYNPQTPNLNSGGNYLNTIFQNKTPLQQVPGGSTTPFGPLKPIITPSQVKASTTPPSSQVKPIVKPVTSPSATATPTTPTVDTSYTSTDPAVMAKIKAANDAVTANKDAANASLTAAGRTTTGTTPTAPTVTPYVSKYQDIVDALTKQLSATETPTQEESALTQQINDLVGNTNLGITGLEGQGRGIPLGLVRGQQGLLEQQGNEKAQTLQSQLANLIANRQSQQNAIKDQLTNAQSQYQNDMAQSSPTSIGNGIIRYNPSTGKYDTLYTTPADQQNKPTQNIQEYEYAKNNGYKGTYLDYLKEVSGNKDTGSAGFTLNPGETRYDVNGNPIASSSSSGKPPSDAERKVYGFYTRAQDAEKNVQNALQQGDINYFAQGILPNFAQSSQYQQYKQGSESWIKAVLRQESGAAISPGELDSYFKTFFPQSGDSTQVIAQKAASRQSAMASLAQESGSLYQGNQSQGLSQEDMDYIRSQGVDPSVFSNDLSMSQNGSSAVAIANAIKKTESNGNYSAVGASGEHGAYQFMPATWSSWARQYLGDANAAMTPQNQDKVATAHIQDLINQGYNPQQIALLWNSGQTTPVKGVNSSGVAYDSGAYANKVLGNLYG